MSGDHNKYVFEDDQDCKVRVTLTLQMYNHATIMDNAYPDDVQWQDVLGDIVKTVEASYGYAFDLEGLGIYYTGKEDG